MYPCKIKSRLNSLEDVKSYASLRRMTRSNRSICSSRTNDQWWRSYSENKTTEEDYTFDDEMYESYDTEYTRIANKPKRSLRLIQDYKQFRAARSIQRFVRGWQARQKYAELRAATIVIQSAWRRFHQQRKFFILLEETLQRHIENYFHRAATKIQALFRGWWVRHNVHDHTRLMHMQMTAGEDLLHCVAFKLHHLLRTYTIPGVFSLKNTTTLSKVEELLASMTFKQCNDRARWLKRQHQNEVYEKRKQFQRSELGTKLPYAGPNIYNACEPKCLPLYSEADADRKMMKILKMFEEATKQDVRVKRMKSSRGLITESKSSTCIPPLPNTFCGDIVRSMRKWKLLTEEKFTVPSNVMDKPENVEKFLIEMRYMWNALHRPCYCEPNYAEIRAKEEAIRRERRSSENKLLPHLSPHEIQNCKNLNFY